MEFRKTATQVAEQMRNAEIEKRHRVALAIGLRALELMVHGPDLSTVNVKITMIHDELMVERIA